jgi:hypothetical protein
MEKKSKPTVSESKEEHSDRNEYSISLGGDKTMTYTVFKNAEGDGKDDERNQALSDIIREKSKGIPVNASMDEKDAAFRELLEKFKPRVFDGRSSRPMFPEEDEEAILINEGKPPLMQEEDNSDNLNLSDIEQEPCADHLGDPL